MKKNQMMMFLGAAAIAAGIYYWYKQYQAPGAAEPSTMIGSAVTPIATTTPASSTAPQLPAAAAVVPGDVPRTATGAPLTPEIIAERARVATLPTITLLPEHEAAVQAEMAAWSKSPAAGMTAGQYLEAVKSSGLSLEEAQKMTLSGQALPGKIRTPAQISEALSQAKRALTAKTAIQVAASAAKISPITSPIVGLVTGISTVVKAISAKLKKKK